MKQFQSFQRRAKIFGFDRNRRPFNIRSSLLFGGSGSVVIFYFVYLLNSANTFEKYIESIYFTSASTVVTVCVINFAVKLDRVFELIDQFEEIIEKSECKRVFWNTKLQLMVNRFIGIFTIFFKDSTIQNRKWFTWNPKDLSNYWVKFYILP